jgi:hypothetical protein
MNRALFNFELIQSEMLYLFLKLIARIYLFKNAFHLGNLMHNVAWLHLPWRRIEVSHLQIVLRHTFWIWFWWISSIWCLIHTPILIGHLLIILRSVLYPLRI